MPQNPIHINQTKHSLVAFSLPQTRAPFLLFRSSCSSRRRTAAAATANDGGGLVSGVGPRTHCGSPLCSLFSPSRPHFLRPATDSDGQAISRRRPPPARQARWDSNSGDSFLPISTLFPRFGRGL